LKLYGLIGKNLDHSFSPEFFKNKFQKEKINDASYKLFPLSDIPEFKLLIQQNKDLSGLNVTIPYKQSIISYLDELDLHARNIGAVNTIQFVNQKLIGYNTDYLGFMDSLLPILSSRTIKALIIGKGGSSLAVAYALKQLNIDFKFITRTPVDLNDLSYSQLDKTTITNHNLIINTTPLGMFPNISEYPLIPYQYLTKDHLVYDLIYNPEKTQFLKFAKEYNAITKNGRQMLEIQADYSWKIWNNFHI